MLVHKETLQDSTKNKPHYQVDFYTKNSEYIGSYVVSGYHLYNVYVTPEFRGKGMCKKIIDDAVSRKKNLNLDVDPDNIAAIKCYRRAGFKFVREMTYYNPLWNLPNREEFKVLRLKHCS